MKRKANEGKVMIARNRLMIFSFAAGAWLFLMLIGMQPPLRCGRWPCQTSRPNRRTRLRKKITPRSARGKASALAAQCAAMI